MLTILGAFAAVAIVAGGLATSSAAAEIVASAVRIGPDPDKTRFVVDLSQGTAFQVSTLAEPNRVVIDLPEIAWRIPPGAAGSGGLVSAYRFAQIRPGSARIVIDLARPARVHAATLLEPRDYPTHRLVIDLERTTQDAFLRDIKPPPAPPPDPAPRAAGVTPAQPAAAPPRPARSRPTAASFTVVIDPGHGGVDPGAISDNGTVEKDITLAQARELRRQLLATNRYRVVLTRDGDAFLALRDRIAAARSAGGDIFISLHADAIDNKRVRGGSVYTLSETASDKEAELLATKENKADLIAGVDMRAQSKEVVNILIDLAQRETMNASVVFANLLIHEIGSAAALVRNTHRFAGFAVLKAPDVPSVLIEMGYLSNARDEGLLSDPQHRRRLAGAIVRAIDLYAARRTALN